MNIRTEQKGKSLFTYFPKRILPYFMYADGCALVVSGALLPSGRGRKGRTRAPRTVNIRTEQKGKSLFTYFPKRILPYFMYADGCALVVSGALLPSGRGSKRRTRALRTVKKRTKKFKRRSRKPTAPLVFLRKRSGRGGASHCRLRIYAR